MRLVVVTGMSGSGKSTALRALEDAGFYAIDNLPIALFDQLVQLTGSTGEVQKLALGIDARSSRSTAASSEVTGEVSPLAQLPAALDRARRVGHDVELILLDAADNVLERRFSETRRRHPLAPSRSVKDGIQLERILLEPLRAAAGRIIDTGAMSTHELKREIQRIASLAGGSTTMGLNLLSFGYRHGLPPEADLVFDVRFLPNPFFEEALRPLTGEDPACATFVLERPETKTFLDKLCSLLEFLLPQYEHEGKAYLTIAIGCTGGQHRSVAIACRLADWLRSQGREVQVRHRDRVEHAKTPRGGSTTEGGPAAGA